MKWLDDFQCNKIHILISVLIPIDNNHQRQCEGGGDIRHIGEKYDEKKSDVGQVVPSISDNYFLYSETNVEDLVNSW